MKKHCLPPLQWVVSGRIAIGCVLLLLRIGLAHAQSNGSSRGAQMPYTRYESEAGTRGGGATLEQSPQFNQHEIASEASNQQYVSLPANGSYVEWTVGQTVQGVNLRFTLPDNAAGTGQSGSLGLYVNRVKVQTIHLSSYWAYQYFPQGQFEPVQTPGGKTFMRFDEVHFRLADPVTAGSKIRIAKDHGDALVYGVDFLELEPVPDPLDAPGNALWVTAYGAVANDQGDDHAAFTQCLAAAASQGKNVYIPAGRFLLSDRIDLNVTGMKIQGAGIWYTEVYFSTNLQYHGGILARSSQVEISDLSLNTANNGRFRYDEDKPRLEDLYKVYKAFMGTYGTGSRIHDVWVEHFECGFWIAGYGAPVEVTQDLIISQARIRNNYADGVNFCQGTSNSVVEHCSIRNGGDDGLAIWPNHENGAPAARNNVFRFNTIENNWRAGGVAIFGGTGHQVHNNIIRDGTGGSGIRLNTEFPGHSFEPNGAPITLSANTITACGTSYDLWNGERGAIDFFVTQGKGIHNVEFKDMDILNSQRHAIRFEGYQGVIDNIVFHNTNIDGTGVDAFTDPPQPEADKRGGFAIIGNVGTGSATFNNYSFNRLDSGPVRNGIPAFIINLTHSAIPLTGIALSPASLSLAEGNTAPLTVAYSPHNATNKALTWTSSNPAVATVAPTGTGTATVTAKAAGSATITVQATDGGYAKTSTVTVVPTVTIAATGTAGEGGNAGTFTISTSAIDAAVTVAYAVSGTAASPDYTANPALSGSVTLTPAAPSRTIAITPTDDNLFEGAESLTLTLQPGAGFSLGSNTATVSIADNDSPPCTAPVIAFTATAPVIDQDLDAAWNHAPAGPLNQATLGTLPPDFAGSRWRALYDNTHLYVLVEVKDNAVHHDSGTSWWEDDAVELFIDGDNSKGSAYDGINDFQFGFRCNDATVHVGGNSVNRTTGVQFAVQYVTGGYNVEVRIPWATIGVSPAAGNRIGFEVAVDDDDNGAAREAQVAAFSPVSGAFANPSLFGTVYQATCSGPALPIPQPAGEVACYRAPGTIAVNGSLGESGWNLGQPVTKNTIGAGNNTVTFGVLWDDTYLYVGAQVLDDNLLSDSPDAWEDDAVEIFIDANHNQSATYDGADNQIIKRYNSSTVYTRLTLSGLQHAWAPVSGGYSVELAIPWSQLGIAAPADGTRIGFDVGYDDDDDAGSRDAQAVWNGTADNYQQTAAFGTLVLRSANAGARAAAGPSESLPVVLLPNPVTHGRVQVLVPGAAGEVYVQVVDAQGRTVLSGRQAAHSIRLDVAHLAKGVYLALVRTEGKLVTKKFVVE